MTLKESYNEAMLPSLEVSHYPWAKPVMKGKIVVNIFDNDFTCVMVRMTKNGNFVLRTHLEDCRTLFLELPANYPCRYYIRKPYSYEYNQEPKPNKDAYLAFGFEKRNFSLCLFNDLSWKHPDCTT